MITEKTFKKGIEEELRALRSGPLSSVLAPLGTDKSGKVIPPSKEEELLGAVGGK